MNSPVSGSRWEPSARDALCSDDGAAIDRAADVTVAEPAIGSPRPRRGRRRLVVTAILAGVLAVTGAGAAAFGHAVAVAGSSNGSVRTGPDGDGQRLGGRGGQRHGSGSDGGTGIGAGAPAAGTST